jgi:hypothetical protein
MVTSLNKDPVSMLFILDMGGTFFFAISGAFRAVKY